MSDLLPLEVYVILAGVAVVAVAWLLLRFGKIIARWALIFGGLAAVIIVGLALLSQSTANKEVARTATMAVEAATVTGAGLSISAVVGVLASAFCVGVLGVALLFAFGGVGYLWIRWRLAEQQKQRGQPGSGLVREQPPLPSPQQLSPPPEPVIYVLESEVENVDALDMAEWGW